MGEESRIVSGGWSGVEGVENCRDLSGTLRAIIGVVGPQCGGGSRAAVGLMGMAFG